MKRFILLIMGIIVMVGSANAQHNHSHSHGKVQAKGYAAMNDKGQLVSYEFERCVVGDNAVWNENLEVAHGWYPADTGSNGFLCQERYLSYG